MLAVRNKNPIIPDSLINPFTGASCNLPCSSAQIFPLSDPYPFREPPLIFACDDSGSVILAACMSSSGLYGIRVGDTCWNEIKSLHSHIRFVDRIVYHAGRFYILETNAAQIVVLDKNTLEETDLITLSGWSNTARYSTYLYVSTKELMLINDFRKYTDGTIDPPRVFTMDRRLRTRKWIEVKDIGRRAIFVDSDIAFSLKAHRSDGLRKNCIYFTRAFRKTSLRGLRTFYVVVFDLKEGKWRSLRQRVTSLLADHGSWDQIPKWIVPRYG